MKDKEKTKELLIYELLNHRHQINCLETFGQEGKRSVEEINRSYQAKTVLNK
jgi:hypothetical protein